MKKWISWSSARQEARTLLTIGLPIIIAQLLQMSMNFIDTVMAGRLSALDLASVAVGSSILMPFIVFGLGTVMAINPIVAQNFGGRQLHEIGTNVRQSLWISQMIALPVFLMVRHPEPLFSWMGIEPDVATGASNYLKAISWGLFPVMAYGALRYFSEGMSVTKPGMYVALIGTLSNIPLNYIMMYGKLGFPELGATGTGYASAIVWGIMFGSMMLFTFRFRPYQRFQIFQEIHRPDPVQMRQILGVGIPIGVSSAMEVTLFAAVTLMMGTLGTTAVAGHQIAINVAALAFMIPFGLSMAITSRVGQAAGKGRTEEARFRGMVGITLCTLAMCCTALFMMLIPGPIVSIYTSDPAVREIAMQLLALAAIFQISDGLQVGGFGALRGLKDTRFPMVVNILSYALFGLSLAWFLGVHIGLGPVGLWIGLIAGLTLTGLGHNLRFIHKTKS